MKRDDLFENQGEELSEGEEEPQVSHSLSKAPLTSKKVFMPSEFHKGKRTLTKVVNDYFVQLKDEILKGAKICYSRAKLENVIVAISQYVGVRYGERKQGFELLAKQNEQSKKKEVRGGLFSYLSESEKIINYTVQGKINIIPLDKGGLKLPDLATPIPHQRTILLLDPCRFDYKRKTFIPCPPALFITLQGKVKQQSPPLLFRSKCAIIRERDSICLLGGYATEEKILTNRCERYNVLTGKSQEMPSMLHKHNCPTACLQAKCIWVFSTNYLENFDGQDWREVPLPFGGKFLPFQFVYPLNQNEILIFGGTLNNEKSCQLKVYNTKDRYLNNYGMILPQGICNERNWGPAYIQGSIAVLSSIQASVYPQIGVKSSMSEIIYISESSAYLNCIVTV